MRAGSISEKMFRPQLSNVILAPQGVKVTIEKWRSENFQNVILVFYYIALGVEVRIFSDREPLDARIPLCHVSSSISD